MRVAECEALGCQQRCLAREAASDEDDATSLGAYDGGGEGGDAGREYMCACNEGYRLAKDNKTCEEQGKAIALHHLDYAHTFPAVIS